MDRRRTEKINQAKTKEKHLAEEYEYWFVICPLGSKHKLWLNLFFLREKIEINKSYVNEVVQNIKRVSRGSEKGCFCLDAMRAFTSFCVCSLKRPRPNATISWWSSTMSSCRRYKIWNQRLKRLIKSSKVVLGFVASKVRDCQRSTSVSFSSCREPWRQTFRRSSTVCLEKFKNSCRRGGQRSGVTASPGQARHTRLCRRRTETRGNGSGRLEDRCFEMEEIIKTVNLLLMHKCFDS